METPADPPFDPRWLDRLADALGAAGRRPPRLEDVYLEQTLELEMVAGSGPRRARECRSEGTAVRWRDAARTVSAAASGVSPAVLSRLVARRHPDLALPAEPRPVPPAELDPPRGWYDWATTVLDRLDGRPAKVRYRHRRATVLLPGGWRTVQAPPLARVEVGGPEAAAALAVWTRSAAADWLARLAEPRPPRPLVPESGRRLPVVLSQGTAGVLLHELVGHLVEGDLVLSGASPLARMADATVTAATVTILDDPTRTDLPGGFSCDDEGVPATPLAVVTDGRLTGWICDRASAAVLGAEPGRGRRPWWSRPPVARLSNLVVAAGTVAARDLEADLVDGLVVTRLGGATVDPLSGRVVLRVERGWQVRHGRRRRPLAACELTGGALEVLASVDPAVGDDPRPDWRLGWCVKDGQPLPTGSEAPSMLVTALEVL